MRVTIYLKVLNDHPILEFTIKTDDPMMLINSKIVVIHGHPMKFNKEFEVFHLYSFVATTSTNYYFDDSRPTSSNISSIIEQLMNTG